MKQKLFSLLLAAAIALPLAGCGNLISIFIINSGDGPGEVLVNGPGFSDPTLPALPETGDETGQPALEQEGDGQTGDIDLYEEAAPLDEDGTYNSAEDVSLYLYTYDHLPDNYITKDEARELGWTGGSVEQVAPGCAIGGDRFGNREGILPDGSYHECDIGTDGASSRGAKRLVYSDEAIYYTEDHYESFTQLAFYEEDGVLTVECEGSGHHGNHHS